MPTYHEMVIEGARGQAFGFITGYLAGQGKKGEVFDAEREGFDCEPLRERVRELFRPSADTAHLLVPGSVAPLVRQAVEQAADRGMSLTLHEERRLSGARFAFRFNIYSRVHAARIRSLLEKPPRGASLTAESRFEETLRPEAKGVEAYAPEHDYELAGSGAVEGSVDAVVSLHRRCRTKQLIQLGKLEFLPPEPNK